jgi:hypothetical protein
VGDPIQTWSFEVVRVASDHTEVRIRHVASGLCVQQPSSVMSSRDVPVLEPCDGSTTVFSIWPNGDISFEVDPDRYCLLWGSFGATVSYGSCNTRSWFISGPLESSDGFALGVASDAPSPGPVAEPLNGLPESHQVFDVHF